MPKIKSLIGRRFGRLVVIRMAGHIGPHIAWECKCDCGNLFTTKGYYMTQGDTKSCGCAKRKSKVITLQISNSPEYRTWRSMLERCYNPRNSAYKNYGGRGIKVCNRWHEFKKFLLDMGEKPEGLTIERVNNDLGYSPENCKWATMKEQIENQRHNCNISRR